MAGGSEEVAHISFSFLLASSSHIVDVLHNVAAEWLRRFFFLSHFFIYFFMLCGCGWACGFGMKILGVCMNIVG